MSADKEKSSPKGAEKNVYGYIVPQEKKNVNRKTI